MILPIIVIACLFVRVSERPVALWRNFGVGVGGEIAAPVTYPGVGGGSGRKRLSRLPLTEVGGLAFPVAVDRRARLLGLAWLDRDDALPGLLIPDCASVHTFWMRFPLDIRFLDRRGALLAERLAVPPRRIVFQQGAAMVLERPAPAGGESSLAPTWEA
jgi:uncharacterized protein